MRLYMKGRLSFHLDTCVYTENGLTVMRQLPDSSAPDLQYSRRTLRRIFFWRCTLPVVAAVRLLTKMCMVLEDDNVIVCKPDAPAAKKLGKLMYVP